MLRIIAGRFRNISLNVPQTVRVRPTKEMVRGALFNICQSEIAGARFLDVCAGSGAMGFEALSRGAKEAVLLDKHRPALESIRKNIEKLQVQAEARLLAGDVFKSLQKLADAEEQFDLIYCDPPYEEADEKRPGKASAIGQLLHLFDENRLLKPLGRLFIEDRVENRKVDLQTLRCVDTRRYGITFLKEYRLI